MLLVASCGSDDATTDEGAGDTTEAPADETLDHAPREEWSTDRRTEVELVPPAAPGEPSARPDGEPPLA